MQMSYPLTCSYCKKTILPGEELEREAGLEYHPDCLEQAIEDAVAKQQANPLRQDNSETII